MPRTGCIGALELGADSGFVQPGFGLLLRVGLREAWPPSGVGPFFRSLSTLKLRQIYLRYLAKLP